MFDLIRSKDINQLYAYEMLQKFAFSLIGIFIPIYIASQNRPLIWVFIYLFSVSLSFMVLSFPVSFIISKIGFKHSLLTSYLFYLPAFLGLRIFEPTLTLILFTGVFLGIGKAFHWISLHSEFALDSEKSKRSKESSRLIGLPKISKAVAPFMGGLIMASYGFSLLVMIAFSTVLASAIPLLLSKDHKDPLNYNLSDFLDREHSIFASLFILRGMGIATGIYLFPLFVYFVIGNTVDAGATRSLANIGALLFTLLVGRISSKVENSKMIVLGALTSALFFFLRAFVSNSTQAFIVSISAGLLFMIYYIPLYSTLANYAEKEDIVEFYALRETFLSLGKIIILTITAIVTLKYSIETGLKISFYLTGLATLIIPLFTKWIDIE